MDWGEGGTFYVTHVMFLKNYSTASGPSQDGTLKHLNRIHKKAHKEKREQEKEEAIREHKIGQIEVLKVRSLTKYAKEETGTSGGDEKARPSAPGSERALLQRQHRYVEGERPAKGICAFATHKPRGRAVFTPAESVITNCEPSCKVLSCG